MAAELTYFIVYIYLHSTGWCYFYTLILCDCSLLNRKQDLEIHDRSGNEDSGDVSEEEEEEEEVGDDSSKT